MITRGKTLTTEELAYIAGIMDGEGNINIYRIYNDSMKLNGKPARYELSVAIYNTNESVIHWLYELFGGNFSKRDHTNKTAHKEIWKASYTWRIQGNQSTAFLQLIHPYLRIKKVQADIAIEFMRIRKEKVDTLGQFARMTQEQADIYHVFYTALRDTINSPVWQMIKLSSPAETK